MIKKRDPGEPSGKAARRSMPNNAGLKFVINGLKFIKAWNNYKNGFERARILQYPKGGPVFTKPVKNILHF